MLLVKFGKWTEGLSDWGSPLSFSRNSFLGTVGLRWVWFGRASFPLGLFGSGDKGVLAAGESNGFEWEAAADTPVVQSVCQCVDLALLVLAVESPEVGAVLAEHAELGFLGLANSADSVAL